MILHFPQARVAPVAAEAWERKLRVHAAGGPRVDPACPVNGENHLERAILEVFPQLRGAAYDAILNIGGLSPPAMFRVF